MATNYVYYKDKIPLEERKKESNRIIIKFPNRIPVLVEKCDNKIGDIDKNKYLVPKELTLGQFAYVIRKRLKISPDIGIFYFVNNKMFPMNESIIQIYDNEQDDDGFLYIRYGGESTFG